MTDDYIPQPRPELSDEAAALVLDFLYDLITDFESAYAQPDPSAPSGRGCGSQRATQQLPVSADPRRRPILKSGKPAA